MEEKLNVDKMIEDSLVYRKNKLLPFQELFPCSPIAEFCPDTNNNKCKINISNNIKAKVVDNMDEAIISAIYDKAVEDGINTLLVFDKKFILDAVKEKIAREYIRE